MIETILKERSIKLTFEILNQGLETGVATEIYTTDLTGRIGKTGEELIRFRVYTNVYIYNVFIQEKNFKDKKSEINLYENIAKSIIKCEKENSNFFKSSTFLVFRDLILNLDDVYTKDLILNLEKAREIYNILIDDDTLKLSEEEFFIKFKSCIFEIYNIKVINILNVLYDLTV